MAIRRKCNLCKKKKKKAPPPPFFLVPANSRPTAQKLNAHIHMPEQTKLNTKEKKKLRNQNKITHQDKHGDITQDIAYGNHAHAQQHDAHANRSLIAHHHGFARVAVVEMAMTGCCCRQSHLNIPLSLDTPGHEPAHAQDRDRADHGYPQPQTMHKPQSPDHERVPEQVEAQLKDPAHRQHLAQGPGREIEPAVGARRLGVEHDELAAEDRGEHEEGVDAQD